MQAGMMDSSKRVARSPRPGEGSGGLLEDIRAVLRNKDIDSLADMYVEDAILEELSSLSPPSHPTIVEGREALRERFRNEILRDPVSGWARHLDSAEVTDAIETEDAIAFTEVRTYAAGDKVVAQHLAHKRGGLIERDRVLVVWDAK
jgi:hypothetical protein